MKKNYAIRLLFRMSVLSMVLAFVGCSSTKDIPEGSYSLEGVKVVCDDDNVNTSSLNGYIRQQPTPKWFSLIKKPGAKPVIYDSIQASLTCLDLQNVMKNMGYLHAKVMMDNQVKDNKIKAVYKVVPGETFYIRDVEFDIKDDSIKALIEANKQQLAPLRQGERFSVSLLNDERKRITSLLTSNGYYHFHKDFIEFDVDTAYNSSDVDVRMTLEKYKAYNAATPTDHPLYYIRKIIYKNGDGEKLQLRRSALETSTAFKEGDLYDAKALQKTYNNFARMQAVRYTNITFEELSDTTLLDCDIQISTNKPSTVSIQPEGTNTAGDLGAALALTYENRNLFHGSELLSIQMRGAYEAIRGLEGYGDQDYQEYGIESKLSFPRFLAPFLSSKFKRESSATTELSVGYNLQNRPEFHRRVFSTGWRYKWNNVPKQISYRLDLLDLNYVYMPWISDTFRQDYLESSDNRNAILRYNYEDLFIMKIGFATSISRKNWALRTNIETSGNLLDAVAHATGFKQNADGQYTFFNIAFAQYVKGDVDYTKQFNFDKNNQLVMHAGIGVAYPYGNSNILPFEKRYFSGGANSVRGWSVRSLGPGRFKGTDGRIDFINQTGDVKLDLNLEYRTKLFWKINGAAFIDAGNIWTVRDYADQPGGQFRFDEFYKQIAVAYGLGFRFNFGYFILRFDFGMKAVNPAYETSREHYPIFHPDLGRDLAVHFAVGMPF